jgi:hydroxyacylglutathione hydrolase
VLRLSRHVWLIGSGQVGLSNPMDCHVYLVGGSDAFYLVDAGVGIEPEHLLANLRATGAEEAHVRGLLLTHVHSDHAGGARALSEALSVDVLASEAEARQLAEGTDETLGLERAKVSGIYPEDYQFQHHQAAAIPDGWRDGADDWSLRAVVAPGHSVGSTAYVLETSAGRDLFCGDTVFWGGKLGLLNCWGSSAEAYRENFHRLVQLDIAGFYPGHQLFAVADGQRHLNAAAEALAGVYMPESF